MTIERDDYSDFIDDDDTCWQCGGEGFVSSCFAEYECIYPEDGCDECTRPCPLCGDKP